MRAGTENVAGIIGLAKAAQIAMTNRDMRIKKEKMLRDYMIKKVTTQIKDVWLNGDEQERLPNNMNFSFKGVDGATLILMLDQQGYVHLPGQPVHRHKKSHRMSSKQ